MTIDRRHGARFDDADVAGKYLLRAPYAAELYEFLREFVPKPRRALDLCCGPGKIAGQLATWFERVDAVDSSLPMLQRAQMLHSGVNNIRWIHAAAEDAVLEGPYDIVTIGTAAHWMDHGVVFPKLAGLLAADGVLAMIEGDRPHEPPWEASWMAFVRRWLTRIGLEYDKAAFGNAVTAHERWMNVAGRRTFGFDYRQSVSDFVACQHSRATWTIKQLGAAVAAEFDRELTEMLVPFARDGQLEFSLQTNLVWGTPCSSPVEP